MTVLLDGWLAFSRNTMGLQQFGQVDDESTFNGATGCTHTILQRLIRAKTGLQVSHDQISIAAGYPWPANNPGRRGLRSGNSGTSEVERVFKKYGLPYKVVFGQSFTSLQPYFAKGPVMIGIRYGWWPEDRGYVYHGAVADGKPNGFAARNGKTQLTGFESGFHAVLLLGQSGTVIYANEPNHGSAARPEHPDFDVLTVGQAKNAYASYASGGRSLLAWVPTTTLWPKGYETLWGSTVPADVRAVDPPARRTAAAVRKTGHDYGTTVDMIDLETALKRAGHDYGSTVNPGDLQWLLDWAGK